jgi:hypothetical protein
MTLAPLFSRISLTCAPALPMMIDASWVTIRQRMCMLPIAGAPGAVSGVSSLSPFTTAALASGAVATGEDAAETWSSSALTREGCSSPVLSRFDCCCASLSEGERERFRVVSASGMVGRIFSG